MSFCFVLTQCGLMYSEYLLRDMSHDSLMLLTASHMHHGCTMNAKSSLLLTWSILRAFIFREHLEE